MLKMEEIELLDEAWDLLSEYIGVNKLKTPLTIEQFEKFFKEINKDKKFDNMKEEILYSFRYDSYKWPLVERD